MDKRVTTLTLLVIVLFTNVVLAGTTGKIKGKVTDPEGLPLIGVNIMLVDTDKGAVTNLDGFYDIVNIDPGTYTLLFKYVGYADKRVTNVKVIVDKTTEINVVMEEASIQGEEITVVAERPIVEVDKTTTSAVVDGETINSLPIVNVDAAVDLQAGVNDGHFRGGRLGEVSYMVNGVPINNALTNEAAFEVEPNMISSLEVISGVFNAEYGQALSGVVNVVTKGVQDEWTGNISSQVGMLASPRDFTFVKRTAPPGDNLGIEDFESDEYNFFEMGDIRNLTDIRGSISGPIIPGKLGLNLTGRFFQEKGSLFARNLFLPSDSSANVNQTSNTDLWRIESNGDQEFDARNGGRRYSINAGLNYEFSGRTKLEYNLFLVDGQNTFYDHFTRYVPEGRNTNFSFTQNHIMSLKQTFGDNTFANLSYQYQADKNESYLFESPFDERHLPPEFGSTAGANGFSMGGNDLGQSRELTQTHTVIGSITSQINRSNQIKAGFEAHQFILDNYNFAIDVNSNTNFQPQPTTDPFRRDSLFVKPVQYAAYIQDKLELNNLIINMGLRFDYFNAKYDVPVDFGAANQLTIPDPENPGETISNRRPAEGKKQFSPRIGLSFPISEQGVMRFSYGVFFQRPPLSELFRNPNYEVNPASTITSFGNADIDPEQSTSFEIGLQYGFTDNLGLDMTVYSRDIRNLIGLRFDRDFSTANQIIRLVNQDIGTVRGVTISLQQRMKKRVAWTMDYTLQFAEGSASDPADAFLRAQNGQQENVRLQRLDWDRRHIINNTFTLRLWDNVQLNFINNLETGNPYTSVRFFIQSFEENNLEEPVVFNSDLRMTWALPFFDRKMMLDLLIENITDTEGVVSVFNDTGFADQSLSEVQFRRSGTQVGGVNTLGEFFERQEFFSRPRRISLGIKYNF